MDQQVGLIQPDAFPGVSRGPWAPPAVAPMPATQAAGVLTYLIDSEEDRPRRLHLADGRLARSSRSFNVHWIPT